MLHGSSTSGDEFACAVAVAFLFELHQTSIPDTAVIIDHLARRQIEVFLMVLGAALVHATWNALVKTDGDRLSLIKLMSASLVFIPFVSVPPLASWPYLVASSVFNSGYMLMLNRAYGAGDLSLVYSIARGVAPLAVAVVSISILGENLSHANQGAVLLIGLGITSLALVQRPTRLTNLRPFLFALATGAFNAAYTIVDGLGARVAGSAHGYVIWLSLVTSLLIVNGVQWLQQGRSLPLRSGRGPPASLLAS